MSYLYDDRDPTTALFLSTDVAERAGNSVIREFPDRVAKCVPKLRTRNGQHLGYALIIFFKDKRPPSPLTNSDFERLTVGA